MRERSSPREIIGYHLSNKKMPPSTRNWTAQNRLRSGTRSGRRNGVWSRPSRDLLELLVCRFAQLVNAQRRNFISPLVDSLNRDPQGIGDLLHGAELFDCVVESHVLFNHSLN